jgi:anti-sigma B factor antagonist
MDLAITFEKAGTVAILHCDGRIVFGPHCQHLTQRCQELLNEYSVVALDLSGVTALDSAGIGTMVRLLTSARRNNADIKIIAPSARALHVLEVTKLDKVFDLLASPKDIPKNSGQFAFGA